MNGFFPKITRRAFMRLAGIMGGASLFAGCTLGEHPSAARYMTGAPDPDPVETLPGVKVEYTVCGLCPGNCGIGCRVAAGCLIKIGGNPYHPVSTDDPLGFDTPVGESVTRSGSVCAIGGSGVQTLYDPFRVVAPLKRIGPRGSAKWKPISWKQAIREIVIGGDLFGEGKVKGLKDLKEAGKGFALLAGRTDWGSLTFLKSFIGSFPGGLLLRDSEATTAEIARKAADEVFGKDTGPVVPDYGSASVVLSFGDAALDSGVPIVSITRRIASSRVDGKGFRWAVIDPRLSTSASKADLWVPVIPGKDLELVLGIMKALAEDHSTTIEPPSPALVKALRSASTEEFALAAGVTSATVRKLAGMLAQAGPRAAAVPGPGVLAGTRGLETATAVLALNTMVGSAPGTGGLAAGMNGFLKNAEEKLLAGSEPDTEQQLYAGPVDALMLWRSDPVYHDPETAGKYFSDRSDVPLFVAVESTITETAALADYILPDTTYLERWDICPPPPGVCGPGFGLRKPVAGAFDSNRGRYVPLLAETKLMEDVVMSIADALDLPCFKSIRSRKGERTWTWYENAVTAVLEAMARDGLKVKTSKRFVREIALRGGIFLPAESRQRRPHESADKTPSTQDKPIRVDLKPAADSGTLNLITYSLPFHRSPIAARNSWLMEVLPENRLMMNPVDAKKRNISDRDWITLKASDGKRSLKCRAQVIPGIRPGVVALARGYGNTGGGAQGYAVGSDAIKPDETRGAGVNPAGLSKVRVGRV